MKHFIQECIKTLGVEKNTTSHSEKYISAIGVFISMAGCYMITQYSLSDESTHLFVASMAASAVLLFAIPHGALSQPWPLIMGNILSAIIGVTCYKYLGSTLLSACIAVSISVLVMYYLGCLHPPGGATAFFAVTSGADVHALGFDFVWLVIAANIACLLTVAVLYNGLFHWRRYPAHLFKMIDEKTNNVSAVTLADSEPSFAISEENIIAALQQTNSFVDVAPEELIAIFESASQHAETTRLEKEALMQRIMQKRNQKIKSLRRKKLAGRIPFNRSLSKAS
jgi:CBS domain-containing membrane protein